MGKREFKKPKREKSLKGNLKAKPGNLPKREFKATAGNLGILKFK